MSLPNRTDVLIVGAGPTGLAAALSLHKQGCTNILVVDSIVAGENTSRALVVHAATLEALDEIGCAEPLVKAGTRASGGKLWDGDRFHQLPDFSILTSYTKFPFILLVPQHITERVLGKQAQEKGIQICRPFKVVDLKVNESDPNCIDVVFEDGQVVQTRYLIGADGARSTVRQQAKIGYADPDGEDGASENITQAVLADVIFASPPPVGPTELFFIAANGNFFLCIPLPQSSYGGEQAWRIATGVPTGAPPHAPSTEYLQGVVDAYGPRSIPASALPSRDAMKIEKTIWSTRFRTHSAIAETSFARLAGGFGGVVILVGDAAHLHPPAGGQGMNLGLRDAVFLGPVLAEHLQQSTQPAPAPALDAPLKKWANDRHSQAMKVIALAKGILAWASAKDEITWYHGFIPVNWVRIRNLALWIGDVTGIARKTMPWRLSGLANR